MAIATSGLATTRVGQLNNECGNANLDPVFLDESGVGLVLTADPRQTLLFTVLAAGLPVEGATVRLLDLLGQSVPVYDPDAEAETVERTTDGGGEAVFLFAPTGLVTVEVEAPGGATGRSLELVASCTAASIDV